MAHQRRKLPEQIHTGFQIAPMIDVVFVIMLFFMVMAGQMQREQSLDLKLPGHTPPRGVAVEESQIQVRESGEILFNDEEIGSATDTKLTALKTMMNRLRESRDAAKEQVFVTIQADEQAPYQRVVDVLNTLSTARIRNVTFEVP